MVCSELKIGTKFMIKKYNTIKPFAFTMFDNHNQEYIECYTQQGEGVTLDTETGGVDIHVNGQVFRSLNYPGSVEKAVFNGILEEFVQ